MSTGSERRRGVGDSLCLCGRGISIDFRLKDTVDINIGNAGPLIAIRNPASRRACERKRGVRARRKRQRGAATAIETAAVRVPGAGERNGGSILFDACE